MYIALKLVGTYVSKKVERCVHYIFSSELDVEPIGLSGGDDATSLGKLADTLQTQKKSKKNKSSSGLIALFRSAILCKSCPVDVCLQLVIFIFNILGVRNPKNHLKYQIIVNILAKSPIREEATPPGRRRS